MLRTAGRSGRGVGLLRSRGTLGRRIVVIGAGMGGLSAAIRLRAAGCDVTVLEKNPMIGGKLSQLSQDGFRWDTGPSVITMRPVFEDVFHAAGRSLDDYVSLIPVEPMTRYFWPDGIQLDVTADAGRLSAELERRFPGDGDGYRRYLDYAAEIYRVTGPVFIYSDPPRLSSFLRVPMRDWLKADPFRTMSGAIDSFVTAPQLRQLLGRFATYVGGSPYLAPATLNVIAAVELIDGVWYPRGGVYALGEAFRRLAVDSGVDVRTDSDVRRIVIDGGRARGVELADGTVLPADAVVSNVDITTTYRNLLADTPSARKTYKRLARQEPSCSGFVLLLGIDRETPELAHHNVLFSADYRREFDQIFSQHRPADDPTVYIAITSKTDPDHAPAGMENWFVLVNAPALDSSFDWRTHAPAYRDRVLDVIERFGFAVRPHIVSETILTPLDLQTASGAYRGALYGASANSRWAAFRRPHNRSGDVPGLYFAGGTTHPGGGVPMVTLSGKAAAGMVLDDLS